MLSADIKTFDPMPAINHWNQSATCTRRPFFKDVIKPIKSTHTTFELDTSPEPVDIPNGSDNLPLQEMSPSDNIPLQELSPVENDLAVFTEPDTCNQGGGLIDEAQVVAPAAECSDFSSSDSQSDYGYESDSSIDEETVFKKLLDQSPD